jgi:hypothetical protein
LSTFEALRQRIGDRCFICELIAGKPEVPHHIVYKDDGEIEFEQLAARLRTALVETST